MGLLPHLQTHYGPRPPWGFFCAPRVGMGQKISHQRAPLVSWASHGGGVGT